jgi:hypothetical protein
MQNILTSLWIKFVIAGSAVTIATWFASNHRTVVGALIGAFPYITVLVLVFTFIETGRDVGGLMLLSKHFALMIFAAGMFPVILHFGLKFGFSPLCAGAAGLLLMLVLQGVVLLNYWNDKLTV